MANEIKKFEALIKKDLQAKERWDKIILIIKNLIFFKKVHFTLTFEYLETAYPK